MEIPHSITQLLYCNYLLYIICSCLILFSCSCSRDQGTLCRCLGRDTKPQHLITLLIMLKISKRIFSLFSHNDYFLALRREFQFP